MKYVKREFGNTVGILANDHYAAIPLKIETSGTIVKAGTPVTAAGTKANVEGTPDAIGILMYDVSDDNPNGAVVIHGFIDTVKAQAHSGVTVDEKTKSALPMIKFM